MYPLEILTIIMAQINPFCSVLKQSFISSDLCIPFSSQNTFALCPNDVKIISLVYGKSNLVPCLQKYQIISRTTTVISHLLQLLPFTCPITGTRRLDPLFPVDPTFSTNTRI